MYISKEQLDSRLSGLEKKDNKKVQVNEIKGGRKEGDKAIAPEIKALAAALAATDTQDNIAKELGISQNTVSTASRGLVGNRLDPDLVTAAESIKKDISSKALDTLLGSLGLVEVDIKSNNRKAAINSSIVAKNMAIIVEKMTPKDKNPPGGNAPRILININGSARKEEKDYDTVTVESVPA